MRKIYHLSTCSSCKRIISVLNLGDSFQFQDIKINKITLEQLEEMVKLSGSFESLFSKRAIKYKELGLKNKTLGETDYKKLILAHYTFLKRPVIIIDQKIVIGNDKKNIELVAKCL